MVAGYLRRVRAAAADPELVVVSTGFAQGLVLVLRALAQAGVRCAAFEDPGYGSAETSETVRAAVAIGLRVVHVPVDDLGIDVAALDASGAGVVVVTPAHQSPTGTVLAARRRHALVDWACRQDAFIVEDDYDSEFRYDREPVGVLQGLAPDRVATIGTASKALAPAVRLGWVLAPPSLAAAVAAEKQISDRGSSTLDQLALAALLESGRYDRHLRRMRGDLRRPPRRTHRRAGPACAGRPADRAGGRIPRRSAPSGAPRTSRRSSRPRASGRSACTGWASYRANPDGRAPAARPGIRQRQRAGHRARHRRRR